jgi:hypothetical protein
MVMSAKIVLRDEVAFATETVGHEFYIADFTAALGQLDPIDWRDDWEGWFALLRACKGVGVEREDFVQWCLGDPDYAADRKRIERVWKSATACGGGALYKALADRGFAHIAEKAAQ